MEGMGVDVPSMDELLRLRPVGAPAGAQGDASDCEVGRKLRRNGDAAGINGVGDAAEADYAGAPAGIAAKGSGAGRGDGIASGMQRLAGVDRHRGMAVGEAEGHVPVDARHLSAVLPALSAAIGHPVATAVHRNPEALRQALGLPSATSAIVVLVDGLGYWNIAMRAGHAPYLRSLMARPENQRPISTCMPSTTAAAMGTFGTGTCPGLTGMIGYTQLNTHNGRLAQMIQFRDSLPPRELQRQPTVFERLCERVRVTSVGLPKFADSPLTQAALRGGGYLGHLSPGARVRLAARAAASPGLTYLYIRDTDKVGHAYGWDSVRWTEALERVDAQLDSLRRMAVRGTLIVIVADHGMLDADPSQRIDIAADPVLREGVALVGGEPRAPMLYAAPGVDAAEVAARWQGRLGGMAVVRTRREACAEGVYGMVDERVMPMIGDVVVACADRVTLVDSRTQDDKAMGLPSVHGSRSAMEMDIPCLVDVA